MAGGGTILSARSDPGERATCGALPLLDAMGGLCDDPRHPVAEPFLAVTVPRFAAIRPPFVLLLLAMLLPWPAGAVTGEALFTAEVEVADASPEARAEGIVAAFAVVVTKATGRPEPQALPAWPRLGAEAERLLVEYRYRVEAPASLAEDPLTPRRTLLSVRFDRQGVEGLLRELQLPLWGDTRPTTLLLVAVERGTERFIYTPDALPDAAAAIAAAGSRRGIPLLEPLMDLEDRGNLRFNEVWGGFPEAIERTSARYGPDAVLVGRLFSEGSDNWRAQWTLHLGETRAAWQSRGGLEATLADGLDELADRLAQRYVADASSGEQRVALAVTGIRDPAGYARVMAFLGGLTAVSGIRPRLASREVLELELVSEVAPEALLRTIGLGGVLVPTVVPGAPRDAVPSFRLRP